MKDERADVIIYYGVFEPGNRLLANFRTLEAAEVYAKKERDKRVKWIESNKGEMTAGEYRGAINFATNGIIVRLICLSFSDEEQEGSHHFLP